MGSLVAAGPLSEVTSNLVTPSFGQATAAGNLLVARMATPAVTGSFWDSPNVFTDGWTSMGSGGGVGVAYKLSSSASEPSAPTFTYGSTAAPLRADVLEFKGFVGHAGGTNDEGPFTLSMPSLDAGPNYLVVGVFEWTCTASATYTVSETWSPGGGLVVPGAQRQSTGPATTGSWFSAYITNTNATLVSWTVSVTPSTGTVTSDGIYFEEFSAPNVIRPVTPRVVTRSARFKAIM